MLSFLVAYGTGEGQTAKVATRIASVLDDRGHEAIPADLDAESPDVDAYDAVLVGASIHAGQHQQSVREFVTANRDALATLPTAFFQVSLSAATDEGQEEAAKYVDEFVEETDWHPDRIGQFGGALRYSEYGFLKRLLMKQIAGRTIPGASTKEDTEFTDWDDVEAFAADVASFVEGRHGVAPPSADSDAD